MKTSGPFSMLKFTDKALAEYTAQEIGKEIRAALAEDRDIRNRSNIQGYVKVEEYKGHTLDAPPFNTPYDN